MVYVKGVLFLLLAVLAVVLIVQNYEMLSTPVNFKMDLVIVKYETSDMPLSFVSFITFFIGVLAIALFGLRERFRFKKEIKTLKREARQRDKELNSLRNLPVTTEDMSTEPISEE
ncbi:LapA family protein [Thermodesulfobacteriota bacterium]